MSEPTRLCPSCRAEFRAHVATCSDCGTALVPVHDPADLRLPFSEDLVVVAHLHDDTARRYLAALEETGVAHFAGIVTIDDLTAPCLLVRPEDEAVARRIAESVEAPTLGTERLPDGVAVEVDDAWFDVPDLMPGPEEEAAGTRAMAGAWIAIIGALMALLGVFDVYSDGTLDAVLPWIGSAAILIGVGLWNRQRARRDQLRLRRRRPLASRNSTNRRRSWIGCTYRESQPP